MTEKRETLRYTVKHPCDVVLGAFECDGKRCLTLAYLTSTDPAEHAVLGEDGEYSCWDSDARFVEGGIEIAGNDGPSGGDKNIILTIPQDKIQSISIQEM
jgi:hypothetical protein